MTKATQMRALTQSVLVAILAAGAAEISPVSTAWAESQPRFVAVIDGSGSMWGGLGSDGASKLAAARQALEQTLPQLAPSANLGLVTFGPGCRTAELTVEPTANDAAAVVAPLARFNPRGKGPLSAGLKVAADAFPAGTRGAIVLFHDGLDNCGEDQCAAASVIANAHPGVAIHTISLGMQAAEVDAISCVANKTGGRAYAADDAAGVARALSQIANLIARPEPAPPVPQAAVPPPLPSPAVSGPPRLVASVRLADGKPPLATPLQWRITDAASGKVLHEALAPTLAVVLAKGPVRIEVASGRVKVERQVEIAAEGDTRVDIALDAGIVRFDTGAKRLASDAEEPLIRLESLAAAAPAADAGARISGRDTPSAQAATPLWIARGKAIEALLPPGQYRAIAEYGLARASAPVTVAPGSELNLSLPLEAGRLELTSTSKLVGDIVYQISIDDPDRPGGRREIARTAHSSPSFVLSTGTYYIAARSGLREVRRLVTVRSGEITREAFTLDTAQLTVTATLNGAPAGAAPLGLAITPLTSEAAAVRTARPVSLGQPLDLAAGRYRITVRHGAGEASVSREANLGAGQQQRLAIDLTTAVLHIDTSAAAGATGGARCEVVTGGRVVWRTVEANPKTVLDPGTYTVRCRVADVMRETAITLAAGDQRRVLPFSGR